MSYGIVVCSVCSHEVHQDGDRNIRNGWVHCDTRLPICVGGHAIHPENLTDIKGKWCGRDDGPERRLHSVPDVPNDLSAFGRDRSGMYTGGMAGIVQGRPNKKTGNNDPCPCGSGKKYKKCCRP